MNRVFKNYFYNLSYQILVLVVPLITTPYISRVLGAKCVGIYSYTNSIVQYFILFGCIGLNLYGQREIAYVQHDLKKRSQVFWELLVLRLCTVCVSLVLFYITCVCNSQYKSIFFIMILDIIAAMFDISWFFQGIEDFKKIVIRNSIIKIIGVILIFSCVKSTSDLKIYVLCHSGTILLGNLSMWFYMPKFVSKISLKELRIFAHLKNTVILFIPQIATSVYTILDKTMIGLLTGVEEEVAYYEQSQKIVKLVMMTVTSLGTVMLPRVANLYNKKEFEEIKKYMEKSFGFSFFLAFPMMFGLISISRIIVPWFFGSGYEKVIPNMMTIAPILVMISFSNIIGTQYLLPIGRQKEYTISVIIGCIVNFTMNLILIPFFKSIGAAIASVIAETSVTLIQICFTKKDFDYILILKNNIRYVFAAIFMFVVVFSIAINIPASIATTVMCVLVGSIVYICVLLLLKDQKILDAYKIIKNKLKLFRRS